MIERTLLRTAAESATEAAGSSLARSLYRATATIGLSGALGAGKTAFMRGFLRELGVTAPVTSPTYAVEQRYATRLGEVLHVDLYRLEPGNTGPVLRSIEHHDGIRCVEWPERADGRLRTDIRVTIEEGSGDERTIAIECDDADWPADAVIDAWRGDLRLPTNVARHCDAVAAFCVRAADALVERGTFVRANLVRAAAKTHDLFRFLDFRPGAGPPGSVEAPEDRAVWDSWKRRYAGATHEAAGGAFLRERGFPALAAIVEAHHVDIPPSARATTEQHLVYYADKRLIGDRVVTIDERYADFAVRYGNGKRSPESMRWEEEARLTGTILFPDGVPF